MRFMVFTMISPTDLRYIKLGKGGAWTNACLDAGELRFGNLVPHDIALTGDIEAIKSAYAQAGSGNPSDGARQLLDFYTLGADCLWITEGRGRLWWARAKPEVTVDPETDQRVRKVIGKWSSLDHKRKPLMWSNLSSLLTRKHSYPATICKFEQAQREYLLRLLNGTEHEGLTAARAAKETLRYHLMGLITELDWSDFEVLIDLIFAGSGWRRINAVGGSNQKDSDILLTQVATGERAMVQVKSATDAAEFLQCVKTFRSYRDFQRFFFVAHTFRGKPPAARKGVHLWLGADVADKVLRAGLVDWVMDKAR